MEIKLNLLKEFDAYTLFNILIHERNKIARENCEHKDMAYLLEGNENNEKAKGRLDYEMHCMRLNNEKLEVIDNLIEQLKPMVPIGK